MYAHSTSPLSEPGTPPLVRSIKPYLSTWVIPLLLAVIFGFLAIRTAWETEPAYPDASRHAMNGALIYDVVHEGGWQHPVDYTKRYYAKLPAISLPFHPPVFPVWEALFYSVLGVSYSAARMAVGLAVVLSCVLLYRLVMSTHSSSLLAAGVVVIFATLPISQWMSQEVMLEYPSLVFVLAALTCALRFNMNQQKWMWPVGFAFFSAVAIWTKQHAVFLALVPPALVVLSGSWRRLKDLRMWVAVGFVLLSFAGVMAFSRTANAFTNEGWGTKRYTQSNLLMKTVSSHLGELDSLFVGLLGIVTSVLLVASIVFWAIQRIRKINVPVVLDFYIIWLMGVVTLLFVLPFSDPRYAFLGLPPSIVLVLWTTQHTLLKVFPVRVATPIAVLCVFSATVLYASGHTLWIRGPSIAARIVMQYQPQRVLYCGEHNGAFILAVRQLDPKHRTTIIRGDKISSEMFTPDQWPQYFQSLGISYVVAENYVKPSDEKRLCEILATGMPAPMILDRELPLEGSRSYADKRLWIYRVPNPSKNPINVLSLPSSIVGGGMNIELSSPGELP